MAAGLVEERKVGGDFVQSGILLDAKPEGDLSIAYCSANGGVQEAQVSYQDKSGVTQNRFLTFQSVDDVKPQLSTLKEGRLSCGSKATTVTESRLTAETEYRHRLLRQSGTVAGSISELLGTPNTFLESAYSFVKGRAEAEFDRLSKDPSKKVAAAVLIKARLEIAENFSVSPGLDYLHFLKEKFPSGPLDNNYYGPQFIREKAPGDKQLALRLLDELTSIGSRTVDSTPLSHEGDKALFAQVGALFNREFVKDSEVDVNLTTSTAPYIAVALYERARVETNPKLKAHFIRLANQFYLKSEYEVNVKKAGPYLKELNEPKSFSDFLVGLYGQRKNIPIVGLWNPRAPETVCGEKADCKLGRNMKRCLEYIGVPLPKFFSLKTTLESFFANPDNRIYSSIYFAEHMQPLRNEGLMVPNNEPRISFNR